MPRPVGPASETFYRVSPDLLLVDQHMDFPASFRRELSAAFSLFYFVRPHAIILSATENRPLSDYLDLDAYDRATLLYQTNSSPVLDQQRSLQNVRQGWGLNVRDYRSIAR